MFSRDLKINFGTIQEIANSASNLSNNIDSIKSSLNSMNGIVNSCEGDAASALQEKGPKIIESLDKLQQGLTGMSSTFNDYVDSMCGIISYGDGGINSIVHVNTDQARRKLNSLIDVINSFENFAKGVQPSVTMSNMYSPLVDDAQRTAAMQCNSKLSDIKDLMETAASGIAVFETDFENARKLIQDFENMDDDFKKKIKEVYYDFADIEWYQTTSFKLIAGAIIITAAAAFVIFVPAGGAAVAFAVGVAKNVVAVGVLNTAVEATAAAISGEDMADAVATGLFEGCIEGALVGVGTEAATLAKGTKYAAALASKTGMTEKTMKTVSKLGGEYIGNIASDVAKKAYNSEEIDMGNIVEKQTKKIAWKAFDMEMTDSIKTIYSNKANDILAENVDNMDIGDVIGKVLKNDVKAKATEYGAKALEYSGRLIYDGMGEAYQEMYETGDYEIENISDYYNSKFDYAKLGKAMFKDDIKNSIKNTLKGLNSSIYSN